MIDIYGRLTESVDRVVAAALTRKPLDFDGGGLDVLPPEDSSSFSKHSRDWHELSRVIRKLDFGAPLSKQISDADFAVLYPYAREYAHFRKGTDRDAQIFFDSLPEEKKDMLRMFCHVGDFVDKITDRHPMLLNWLDEMLIAELPKVGHDHPLYAAYKLKVNTEGDNGLGTLITTIISEKYLGLKCSLNWIDVSNVTNMKWLFALNNACFDGDISAWDVSNVTVMSGMFEQSLFNGDISKWDVSKVEYMGMMFNGSEFDGDISKWKVGSVTTMENMFRSSKFSGDISNWDVRNVDDMSLMFYNAKNFNGNLRDWEIKDKCQRVQMFRDCPIDDENKPLCFRKVNEQMTNALTRKPLDFDGNGLDVLPPEDSSSFSKHSRDWYRVDDMVCRGLPKMSSDINAMDAEDIDLVNGYMDGRFDEETMRLCRENGFDVVGRKMLICDLLDRFVTLEPKVADDPATADMICRAGTDEKMKGFYEPESPVHIRNISQWITRQSGLGWMGIMAERVISVSVARDHGKFIPVEDVPGTELPEMTVIRISTSGTHRRDNDIILSVKYFKKYLQDRYDDSWPHLTWKEANSFAGKLHGTVEGRRLTGYIPSVSQMSVLFAHKYIIGQIMKRMGYDLFTHRMESLDYRWWTSDVDQGKPFNYCDGGYGNCYNMNMDKVRQDVIVLFK